MLSYGYCYPFMMTHSDLNKRRVVSFTLKLVAMGYSFLDRLTAVLTISLKL